MPRHPAQLQDPAIVERHAAPIGEVALVRASETGFFDIQFITPSGSGQFDRRSLGIFKGSRSAVARRMMNIHTGVCAAQHAAVAFAKEVSPTIRTPPALRPPQ